MSPERSALLDFRGRGLKMLPDAPPPSLDGIRRVDLSGNRLQALPLWLFDLEELEELNLASNRLKTLPPGVGRLTRLRVLDVSENRLVSLPAELAGCSSLRRLDLFDNSLREFPVALLDLSSLEFLDLSRNSLAVLPDVRGRWPRMETLDLSANRIEALPDGLADLQALRRLNVSTNRLTGLDAAGRLVSLEELIAEDNLLRELPEGLALLPRLRVLAVAGNPLERIPSALEQLTARNRAHDAASLQAHVSGGYEPGVRYFDAPHRTFEFSLALEHPTAANETLDLYFKKFPGAPVSLVSGERVVDLSNVTRTVARQMIEGHGGDAPPVLVFNATNDDAQVGRVSDFATRALNDVDGVQMRVSGGTQAAEPAETQRSAPSSPPAEAGTDAAEIARHAPRAEREAPAHAVEPSLDAEPVDAAVFCPARVAPATVVLVQVFLYPPGHEAEVERQAATADAAATERGTYALPMDLPRGTRVDLRLEAAPLEVLEPDAVVVWRGRPASAQFEVNVPPDSALGDVVARVRIAAAGVPAGTLRFKITVATAATASEPPAFQPSDGVKYRRGFVSYSSKDRVEVLKRVQAFKIAGIEIFQDILNLEEGERWERALHEAIDWCDVFLLFWSKAAASSEWVRKEIDLALKRKAGDQERPPHLQPVPIEGPPLVPPPPNLKELHFNGALLWVIAAESQARGGR